MYLDNQLSIIYTCISYVPVLFPVALSLNPDDGVLLQYCAEVLGKQGKTEEAIKYFEAQLDSQ